jgi:hypothetical protein
MPTSHPIRDDDGEYFSEDPTFGIDSKSDALANAQWVPIPPMATDATANAALAQLIRDRLAPKS